MVRHHNTTDTLYPKYWRNNLRKSYRRWKDDKVVKKSLFVTQNGCNRCPYKGQEHDPDNGKVGCPHGIGIKKYMQDTYDNKGRPLHKKDDIVESHIRGICPERVAELGQHLEMCSTLGGLRQKRSHSLWDMEQTLTPLKIKLNEYIDNDELVFDDEDGDTSLKSLIGQIDRIHHRYHDKLDEAIKQESRFKEARTARMNADDLNDQMAKMKRVNVEKKLISKEDEIDEEET